ncbi:MAG: hydroxymethylbilane synthase, partial [Salibacteraceae bacterium]|nr:hydroxymethylbilane synthase [Salibacteraceae bacterium]
MNRVVKIGSRGSDLALWQANFFQGQLDSIGVDSEIIIIKTKGDRIQHLSFDKIKGKGFFTKEIEEQLLNGDIDIAIHSHKDLETQSPEGLTIAGVSYRENPAELLLTRKECVDLSLPLQFKENAIIGTSSARRKAQVTALRPDITIKDIRGNVPTRIDKLRSGDFDAILLAAAGVSRLNLNVSDLHVQTLDTTLFIPAPAQGVLAYQTRDSDQELIDVLQELHHQDVKNAIDIERGILSGFGGGCHIPIGVHATPNGDSFTVRATFAREWEQFSKRVRFEAQ